MKFISVCSGIEAASVAFNPLGFEPVAFSEIEPFPSAVLAHHYPNTPNWGDMTKFKEWPDAAIDILCGGTPCQSFSVAGLRKGLDDPRGNLMLTFGAIAAKYRPQWLVWENVPGVLSSNGGADFGSFLGMLGELGYGFAYRVLDAQYFGVAQRRRRVFVVACLGDWRSAAAVLFERHSMSGHPAPSRKARQVAPTIPSRSTAGGGLGTDFDIDGGVITMAHGQGGAEIGFDRGPTLTCNHEAPIAAYQSGVRYAHYSHDYAHDRITDPAGVNPALTKEAHASGNLNVAVTFQERGRTDGRSLEVGGDVAYALTAPNGGGRSQERNVLTPTMQVRRLTPVECERLQGFPDGYTMIPWRKKAADECPDGPRYKALGNSWAVPNVRWIGQRMQQVEAIRQEQRAAA